MEKLEHCPFCGEQILIAVIRTSPFAKTAVVQCDMCGARGGIGDDEKDAVAKWNRRDGDASDDDLK